MSLGIAILSPTNPLKEPERECLSVMGEHKLVYQECNSVPDKTAKSSPTCFKQMPHEVTFLNLAITRETH